MGIDKEEFSSLKLSSFRRKRLRRQKSDIRRHTFAKHLPTCLPTFCHGKRRYGNDLDD
jgi:hypothetical protein